MGVELGEGATLICFLGHVITIHLRCGASGHGKVCTYQFNSNSRRISLAGSESSNK